RAEQGAWAEAERGDWLPLLRAAAEGGVLLAGVCTGVMLLARAGIIGDRPATTHQGAKPDLEAAGVKVLDERVVDAGGLVTAGGVTSGIDLGLHLVERLAGPEAAERQATALEYPWARGGVPAQQGVLQGNATSAPAGTGAGPAGHPAPSGHTTTTEPLDGQVTPR